MLEVPLSRTWQQWFLRFEIDAIQLYNLEHNLKQSVWTLHAERIPWNHLISSIKVQTMFELPLSRTWQQWFLRFKTNVIQLSNLEQNIKKSVWTLLVERILWNPIISLIKVQTMFEVPLSRTWQQWFLRFEIDATQLYNLEQNLKHSVCMLNVFREII